MTSGTSSESPLSVTAQDYADCRLVTVSGRIDHTNSDRFQSEISDHASKAGRDGGVVIDLTALEFITSAGLRALLLAQRTVIAAGSKLVITGIRGVVGEVFRISKFDALMTISASPAEAVAEISAAAAEAYAG